MKKMTKIFGTILAASAIFAVASCDGTENSLPVSVSENTSVESIVDAPTSENDKTSDSSISEEAKEYEDVLYSLKADAFEAGKFSSPTTKGQFTLEGEVRGRTKQWINPNNKEETIDFTKSFKNGPITVLAPGNGTLSMYLQNGSSGAASQFVKVTTTIGEESTSESIEFSGATKAG